jgi:hypothetical protein
MKHTIKEIKLYTNEGIEWVRVDYLCGKEQKVTLEAPKNDFNCCVACGKKIKRLVKKGLKFRGGCND